MNSAFSLPPPASARARFVHAARCHARAQTPTASRHPKVGAPREAAPCHPGHPWFLDRDDEARARADPELAVLSAMAHGRDQDPEAALRVAVAAMGASVGLDPERSTLYFDLVVASLGAAAQKALQDMDPAKYEYQSEFARRYFGEGKAEGKAELLARLLTRRFGRLPAPVGARLDNASSEQLDRWAERILDAEHLDDVFGED